MNFVKATRSYEKWLAGQIRIVPGDLAYKRRYMAKSFFAFFRGTFYRWAQLWPEVSPDLAKTAQITSVGDLHVENFGTWRDTEGRLVWGINDFDEAFPMAWANDLVRLLASIHIVCPEGHLQIKPAAAAEVLLDGYRQCLKVGGRPFVLAEEQSPLREMARDRLRDPERFWCHVEKQRKTKSLPDSAKKALLCALTGLGGQPKFAHCVAGVGSLGHERYIAVIEHQGGRIAREAKSRALSACVWAGNKCKKGKKDFYRRLIEKSPRCPDPFLVLTNKWVVRRLSPDCSRLELSDFPKRWDEEALLLSMGWETANIHLADGKASVLLKQLSKIRPSTFNTAAAEMVAVLRKDWKRWQTR